MTDLRLFPAWPLAAAGHAVSKWRARRGVAAAAGAALPGAARRRAGARGHDRRRPHACARRNRTAGRDGRGTKPKACGIFRSASACPAATRALYWTRWTRTAGWPIDGYLISCPYYSRPSQRGLELHFRALADRAAHPVLLYNIPYRTGVNLGNEAMLRLADHPNIVGLKDCSRGPRPVARSLAPASARLRRSDRRGRAISGGADRWRRRRHSGVRAYRDRNLRGDPEADRRRASAMPRCRVGDRSPISLACCSQSRARRRSSTGCGAPD